MDCYNDNILEAKYFLLNIPSKKQFDDIISEVNLTNLEYNIIVKRFKFFKSITDIAMELNISEPTVYKKQHNALIKIYKFLKYYNYI